MFNIRTPLQQYFKIYAACAMCLLFPGIAYAEFLMFPIIYEVTGVADDDVLNVRIEPNAGAYDIGDLLPHAQVEVTAIDDSGKWARIQWHGEDGWVARRYLVEVERFGDEFSGMPVDLLCTGTEPFWAADITSDAQFSFAELGDEADWMPVANSVMSTNMYRSNYAFDTAKFTGLLRRAECSDGMSDMTYGWALDLLEKGADPRLLSGCCRTMLVNQNRY